MAGGTLARVWCRSSPLSPPSLGHNNVLHRHVSHVWRKGKESEIATVTLLHCILWQKWQKLCCQKAYTEHEQRDTIKQALNKVIWNWDACLLNYTMLKQSLTCLVCRIQNYWTRNNVQQTSGIWPLLRGNWEGNLRGSWMYLTEHKRPEHYDRR